MFNIQGLINSSPITASSFTNYKNINVNPIAGAGNFASSINALDFS
jgi:hypothetical protein